MFSSSFFRIASPVLSASSRFARRRTSLRFFVYDTGIYSKPVLLCASGMEGSEVLLHRWLLRSACRTLDAHAADFFYVPFYSFCFQPPVFTDLHKTRQQKSQNPNCSVCWPRMHNMNALDRMLSWSFFEACRLFVVALSPTKCFKSLCLFCLKRLCNMFAF